MYLTKLLYQPTYLMCTCIFQYMYLLCLTCSFTINYMFHTENQIFICLTHIKGNPTILCSYIIGITLILLLVIMYFKVSYKYMYIAISLQFKPFYGICIFNNLIIYYNNIIGFHLLECRTFGKCFKVIIIKYYIRFVYIIMFHSTIVCYWCTCTIGYVVLLIDSDILPY